MTTKGIKLQDAAAMKAILSRIVALLTRMVMKSNGVAELGATTDAEIDYDNEHRCAEHEHEHEAQTAETPESWNAMQRRW